MASSLKKLESVGVIVLLIVAGLAFYAGVLFERRTASALNLTETTHAEDSYDWYIACLELGGVRIVDGEPEPIPGGPFDPNTPGKTNSNGETYDQVVKNCYDEYMDRIKYNEQPITSPTPDPKARDTMPSKAPGNRGS